MRYSEQCSCWDCRETGRQLILGTVEETQLREACLEYQRRHSKETDIRPPIDKRLTGMSPVVPKSACDSCTAGGLLMSIDGTDECNTWLCVRCYIERTVKLEVDEALAEPRLFTLGPK